MPGWRPTATFTPTHILAEPAEPRAVSDAPISADDVRRFDTGLPAIVDAWIAARFGGDAGLR